MAKTADKKDTKNKNKKDKEKTKTKSKTNVNENNFLVDDLTLNQCLSFKENPFVHPVFGYNIELNSPAYENLLDICGKKIAESIEKENFPTLSPQEQKKVLEQVNKEEQIMENEFKKLKNIMKMAKK